MNFDKPKVTIDLEEYQYLKQLDQEKQIDPEKWQAASKKILWYSILTLYGMNPNVADFMEKLKKEGISYSSTAGSTSANTWESLSIKLEDQK